MRNIIKKYIDVIAVALLLFFVNLIVVNQNLVVHTYSLAVTSIWLVLAIYLAIVYKDKYTAEKKALYVELKEQSRRLETLACRLDGGVSYLIRQPYEGEGCIFIKDNKNGNWVDLDEKVSVDYSYDPEPRTYVWVTQNRRVQEVTVNPSRGEEVYVTVQHGNLSVSYDGAKLLNYPPKAEPDI